VVSRTVTFTNAFLKRCGTGTTPSAPSALHGPNSVIADGAIPISTLVTLLRNISFPPGSSSPSNSLSETLNGLLVVDRTNLPVTNCLIEVPPAGTPCAPLFNIVVEFAVDESYFTRFEQRTGMNPALLGADLSLPKAPNIFNVLEKLGLHLEKSKALREFIVIEHIERPSPN
jgi:hypothetical protein